jgi:hypothetical protein
MSSLCQLEWCLLWFWDLENVWVAVSFALSGVTKSTVVLSVGYELAKCVWRMDSDLECRTRLLIGLSVHIDLGERA